MTEPSEPSGTSVASGASGASGADPDGGEAPQRAEVLVVGLGSPDRSDDAVGPVVVAAVAQGLFVAAPLGTPSAPPASAAPRAAPPDSIQDRERLGVGNLDGVAIRGANLDAIGGGAAGGVRSVEIATLADPTALIDLMAGRDLVVVVDAVRSGAAPGTLHVRDAGAADPPLPSWGAGATSTHGFGLAEVLDLARTLGALPERLVVVGVEAAGFDHGAQLSPAVSAAVPAAVAAALDLIAGGGRVGLPTPRPPRARARRATRGSRHDLR